MTNDSKTKISIERSKLRQSIGLWVYAALMELCSGSLENTKDGDSCSLDLKKIAYESVSFPNGEQPSGQTLSLCHIGKPHDIEVKAAVKLFYKEIYRAARHNQMTEEKDTVIDSLTSKFDKKRSRAKPSKSIHLISDFGLCREVCSLSELGHLLAITMEGMPDSIRISDNVRADKNGVICIVTRERQLVLKDSNRLQCPLPWCVKWGKGEKGLWWHQQKEHGTEHTSAVNSASSVANDLAITIYDPLNIWCSELNPSEALNTCNNEKKNGFELVKENDLEGLRLLINEDKFDPKTAIDKNGSGAVLWAAGCGHLNILKYLIEECDCNPEQLQQGKRSFSSRTPLHWAARNGCLEVVEYLVNNCSINIDAKTQDGTTAFCWACWQGHTEVMRFLYENNADVHLQNIFGCNAVQWAAQGEIDITGMQFLLSISCDFLLINSNGHGAVHKCAQRGKESICKWLFDTSCNVPFEVIHVGPDTEELCPSDLAGIEGYTDLATWLSQKEACLALEAYNERKTIPSWLQRELDSIQIIDKGGLRLNSHYYHERWESGAALKRMALQILLRA